MNFKTMPDEDVDMDINTFLGQLIFINKSKYT